MAHFLKQHRKFLKTLDRRELINQVLNHLEIDAHIQNQFDSAYEKLDNEKQICESELIRTEGFLKSAESAIRMYENMSVFQFIKQKYAISKNIQDSEV